MSDPFNRMNWFRHLIAITQSVLRPVYLVLVLIEKWLDL